MLVYAKPTGTGDNNVSNERTDCALSPVLRAVPVQESTRLLLCGGHGDQLPGASGLTSNRTDGPVPVPVSAHPEPVEIITIHVSGC